MATFGFADGLSRGLFHDIDDPFGDAQPAGQDVEDQEVESKVRIDDFEPPLRDDEHATPMPTRASGFISIPLAVAQERAPSRHGFGWVERVLVLGLCTIILAAAGTAVRQHAGDLRITAWLAQNARSHAGTPSTLPGIIVRARPMAPDADLEPESYAVQAALPLQLPEVVCVARARAYRHDRHTSTHGIRRHRGAERSADEEVPTSGSVVTHYLRELRSLMADAPLGIAELGQLGSRVIPSTL